MKAQLIAGLAALFFVLGLTLLRILDERRGEYPAEWHDGVRRLHAVSFLRVLGALAALASFSAVIS